VVVVVGIRQRSTGFPKHARPAAAMKRAEYVSIRADEAPASEAPADAGLDPVTAKFAMAAAVLGCIVSLAAIAFVVVSLRSVPEAS
jgi:hypothetical protein